MSVSINSPSIRVEDLLERVTEFDIISHYFGVTKVPCIINSPLREDNHPSFGFYSNGERIYYTDLATKDKGGIFDLLGKYWGESYTNVLKRVWEDLSNIPNTDRHSVIYNGRKVISNKEYNSSIDLQCKVREWRDYDLEYWESYGISLKWLKYADIYPISHKIVIKDDKRYVFPADKLAYAYVEFKEGRTTLKIYQPLNKKGYKWSNRHDRSVISLWTKVPEYGDKICICSSMKDALCLWANVGIPSLSVQGEGYGMSNTAINELKRRYKQVYICLDNDDVGLKDGIKLAESTGFINIVLPEFKGGKDISDAFKVLGKEKWIELIKPLFY